MIGSPEFSPSRNITTVIGEVQALAAPVPQPLPKQLLNYKTNDDQSAGKRHPTWDPQLQVELQAEDPKISF